MAEIAKLRGDIERPEYDRSPEFQRGVIASLNHIESKRRWNEWVKRDLTEPWD